MVTPLNYRQPSMVRMKNTGSVDIPAFSLCEVESTSSTVCEVKRPTADNVLPVAVSGPFPILAGKYGIGVIDGVCKLNSQVVGTTSGASYGTQADSFVAKEGYRGVINIGGLWYIQNCRTNLLAANFNGGGSTTAAGDPVIPVSQYTLTGSNVSELSTSFIPSPPVIVADVAGTYQFGWSLTAEAGYGDVGYLMTFGLYNETTPGYTGHYAAAENFWDTSAAYGASNSLRANIACTGLVNAAEGDEFTVRNATLFSIDVTHFNFWMLRCG